MVVTDIVRQKPLQVAFTGRNDVVQQIMPTTLHPSLGYSVLPRTLDRGSNRTDSHRPYGHENLPVIFGVPVEDEKSRSPLIGESLPQLLHDPSTRGMRRDIEMRDTPAIMTDDEKAVEDPERQRWYGKEVHRGDDFPMIAQKGEPALGGPGIPRCSPHPSGDGSFGDMETEHQQLAVNTRCAPGWVFRHHPEDQIPNFFRNSPPPHHPARFGDGAPIERKTRSVPADNGLRANDNESLLPSTPELSRQNPEDPIEHR